jgi:hypothetical protein
VHGQGGQADLGAVVEVALDPPPFLVARLRPIVDEGGQWRTERADQRDRPVWTVGRPDTRQSIRVDPPARWRWRLPRFGTA